MTKCGNCVHLDMTQRKHEFEDEYYCNMTLARIDEFNEKNKDMDLMDRFRFLPSFWTSINQRGCSFYRGD